MTPNEIQKIERNLIESIDFARGAVLDMVQLELGETEKWQYLRARILKVFGTRGLELRVREILNSSESARN